MRTLHSILLTPRSYDKSERINSTTAPCHSSLCFITPITSSLSRVGTEFGPLPPFQNIMRSPRYLPIVLLLQLGAVSRTHSLGFTNIFGVIHHKTDEEAKHINDLLEEEDTNNSSHEHLAWFPRGSMVRSIQDVMVDENNNGNVQRRRRSHSKYVKKKQINGTPRVSRPMAMTDEEFFDLLIQLQG